MDENDGIPETTLIKAALRGDWKTMALLIKQGADVNQIDQCMEIRTALFAVCSKCPSDKTMSIVRLLVEHGADMEITNGKGMTCFSWLMHRIESDTLEYLLSVGARVNRRFFSGDTAVHLFLLKTNLKHIIRQGAIMRMNEDNRSPIICNAYIQNTENVKYIEEHICKNDKPTFTRSLDEARCIFSPFIDVAKEIVDAYKLFGVNVDSNRREDIIQYWSKAIRLCEEADNCPKQYVKSIPSCTYCLQVNSECAQNYTEKCGVWDAIRVGVREMVTGTELLQREIKRSRPTWMSNSLPCFHCPTSSPGRCVRLAMYKSVCNIRRCPVFDKSYLEKVQKLQSELQSLYKSNFKGSNIYRQSNKRDSHYCTLRTQRKNNVVTKPTSLMDTFLGIEPTCFVQSRHHRNDQDPISYYLQREWLLSQSFTPPRTTYRCSYSACNICGYMVIRFGGVHPPQSPDFTLPFSDGNEVLVCIRCTLTFDGTGNQTNEDLKQKTSKNAYHSYRSVKDQIQTSVMKVCPHCGLVSEQHPRLLRLRWSIHEAFGDVREFTSATELAEIVTNPYALRLQQLIIKLRVMGQNIPSRIVENCKSLNMVVNTRHLISDCMQKINILVFNTDWPYYIQLHRIISELNIGSAELYSHKFIANFEQFISRALANKYHVGIDPTLLVDYLKLAIDCIESEVKRSFYRCDEYDMEFYWWTFLSNVCLKLIMLVLSYYLPEVPFTRSLLKGECLIDLVVKEYAQGDNNENAIHYPSKFLKKHGHTANDRTSYDKRDKNQRIPSPALIRRFINEVYRLVCLDPIPSSGRNLLHMTELLEPLSFLTDNHERYCKASLVKLLLRLGADPNCIDSNKQTVVGYTLWKIEYYNETTFCKFAALKEGGAHLDAYIRQNTRKGLDKMLRYLLQKCNIYPVHNGRLCCLAATTLQRNGITSSHLKNRAYLPHPLLSFLNLH